MLIGFVYLFRSISILLEMDEGDGGLLLYTIPFFPFFAFNLHYLFLIIRFHFNDSRFERKKCKISRRLSVFDSLETNEKFRSNWWKNISIYEKPVRQIVRQDKSVILRERIARVWSFYLPVIGSGVHEIHLPAEECFSFSLSLFIESQSMSGWK